MIRPPPNINKQVPFGRTRDGTDCRPKPDAVVWPRRPPLPRPHLARATSPRRRARRRGWRNWGRCWPRPSSEAWRRPTAQRWGRGWKLMRLVTLGGGWVGGWGQVSRGKTGLFRIGVFFAFFMLVCIFPPFFVSPRIFWNIFSTSTGTWAMGKIPKWTRNFPQNKLSSFFCHFFGKKLHILSLTRFF